MRPTAASREACGRCDNHGAVILDSCSLTSSVVNLRDRRIRQLVQGQLDQGVQRARPWLSWSPTPEPGSGNLRAFNVVIMDAAVRANEVNPP